MNSFHTNHEIFLGQQLALEKKKSDFLYLPGLNGIRAIAALAVVILHTGFSLKNIGLHAAIFGRDASGKPLDYFFGQFAVSIFFALSGFLITYLLLLEKDKREISIRKFYLRRIYRIWPLYYGFMFAMVTLILLFKVPFEQQSLIYYILLAPNLITPGVTPISFINHFWSIGVEEQFYLFWPWVIKQNLVKVLMPVIIIIALMFATRLYLFSSAPSSVLSQFFMANRFDCMLIGAVGGIIYQKDIRWIIKLIDNKTTQFLMLLAGVLYAVNVIHINPVISHLVISIVTLSIIIGQINVDNRIINLDISIFRYLGKISFGIYVYHQFFIFLFTKLYKDVLYDGLPKYFLMFFSVFASTILVSHLSYKYFESWFIKRKNRYSVIHSSNDPVDAVPVKTYEKISEIKVYRETAYPSS
jgi:peptidoglycan/LPS O-acetylase OafA/YrhL